MISPPTIPREPPCDVEAMPCTEKYDISEQSRQTGRSIIFDRPSKIRAHVHCAHLALPTVPPAAQEDRRAVGHDGPGPLLHSHLLLGAQHGRVRRVLLLLLLLSSHAHRLLPVAADARLGLLLLLLGVALLLLLLRRLLAALHGVTLAVVAAHALLGHLGAHAPVAGGAGHAHVHLAGLPLHHAAHHAVHGSLAGIALLLLLWLGILLPLLRRGSHPSSEPVLLLLARRPGRLRALRAIASGHDSPHHVLQSLLEAAQVSVLLLLDTKLGRFEWASKVHGQRRPKHAVLAIYMRIREFGYQQSDLGGVGRLKMPEKAMQELVQGGMAVNCSLNQVLGLTRDRADLYSASSRRLTKSGSLLCHSWVTWGFLWLNRVNLRDGEDQIPGSEWGADAACQACSALAQGAQ